MKKILCFGDSNTWGHNPVDMSRLEERWTVFLKEMFSEYEIVEDGVCGRSSKFDVPDTPYSNGIEVFRERYIKKDSNFDLIIVMLGTNDQLKYFNCTAEETAETLRGFAREYREKYGNTAEFLLISPILIRDCALKHQYFSTVYNEKSVKTSLDFAKAISEAAEKENVYFLDAAAIANASDLDGIHMDETEHKKLAVKIAEKIKEIL